MKFIRLHITVLLLSISLHLFGQQLQFVHYNSDNGLSHNSVWSIFQDKKGFMWFGTQDGLNRFDGYQFKVYHAFPEDSTKLGNAFIRCIYEYQNEMWIGTDRGIYIFTPETEKFRRFKLATKENQTIDGPVMKMHKDKNGQLWIASQTYGVYCYSPNDSKLKMYVHNENDPLSLGDNNVYSVFEDSKGEIWITGLGNCGINKYLPEEDGFKHYLQGNVIARNRDFYEDSSQRLWVETWTGLLLYNPKKDDFEPYLLYDKNGNQIFKDKFVRSMIEIEKDKFLIGEDGLYVNNLITKEVKRYTSQLSNPYSINDNMIYSLFKDKEGGIWIGTYHGGVNYIKPPFLKYEFYNPNVSSNLSTTSIVRTMCEDNEGKLWIATEDGGLKKMDKKSESFNTYFPDGTNKNISDYNVNTVYYDNNKIWVGLFSEGLDIIDLKTGVVKNFKPEENNPSSLASVTVYDIYKDSEGLFWIGTHRGLNTMDATTNKISTVKEIPWGTFVFQILEDKHQNLWVATFFDGLFRYNKQTKTWKQYKYSASDSKALPYNKITSLLIDNSGTLWIGTEGGGFCCYNSDNDNFTTFTISNGLPSNLVYSMLLDNKNNLWLSTNAGLSIFNIASKNFRNINRNENLISQFNYRSAYKSKDGKFFFGGIGGFISFYPDDFTTNNYCPNISLTGFQLFYKEINNGANSIIDQSIVYTDTILLDYKQNILNFEFTSLSYCTPSNNQYAFKLENFDTEWNFVGNKRNASYTNITPGEYVFKVRGSNNDGKWCNEKNEISVVLIISPPWWQTWWFRIILGIVVVGILVFYYPVRIYLLKLKRAQLERAVQERTVELIDANVKIKQHHDEIEHQHIAITFQKEKLEKQNAQILVQKEELLQQNEEMATINNELQNKNIMLNEALAELEFHKQNLEQIIEERTRDLMLSKERAEESDKLKTSFLTNMSHEIRTPLNAIVGFSRVIASLDPSPEEKTQYTKIIDSNAEYLLSLINDIIDIAKIESGIITVEKMPFDVSLMIKELSQIYLEEMKKISTEKESFIQFKTNLSKELENLLIISDPVRLRQIITNLINNALKFTERGFIETGSFIDEQTNEIVFYVKDSGIGIKPEDQNIIFERFRKVESNTQKLYRGTGLGLAISNHLVMLLGGTISLESEFGKGSTFFVRIPLKKA